MNLVKNLTSKQFPMVPCIALLCSVMPDHRLRKV